MSNLIGKRTCNKATQSIYLQCFIFVIWMIYNKLENFQPLSVSQVFRIYFTADRADRADRPDKANKSYHFIAKI